MLAFIIVLALSIGFAVAGYALLSEDGILEGLGIFSVVVFVVGVFSVIIMLIAIICANWGVKGQIAANQQRYDSLVYQLENNLYDNDNDLGKKELYNEIRDWNENLARGKAIQYDIWVGWFYPNIYDNFEFIELG